MLERPCPIEFFRNAVPADEITNCRDKAADLRAQWRREAAENERSIDPQNPPFLWIISPTMSQKMQETFRVVTKPEWGKGIYFLPDNDWTAIVVVHHLPVNIDTLWLRLLGKGRVQAKAVQEVLALPEEHPYRLETLRHLMRLRLHLEMRQNRSKDLEEVIMNISAVYEEWQAKTLAEGDRLARIEIARQLLSENTPLERIVALTKLSIEQIQALQAEN